jgi:hypothetical protein
VSTSVDRIDRALGKSEQMERVGGSLMDATGSNDVETSGRGEDLFILLCTILTETKMARSEAEAART